MLHIMYMQLLLYGLSVIGFLMIGTYQQLFHSKGGTVSIEFDEKTCLYTFTIHHQNCIN